VTLSEGFDRRFPRLRSFRNYCGHPPIPKLEADEVSWHRFSDGIMTLLSDGRVEYIVDAESDHQFVRWTHMQFVAAVAS
jgi:hypothetical protein